VMCIALTKAIPSRMPLSSTHFSTSGVMRRNSRLLLASIQSSLRNVFMCDRFLWLSWIVDANFVLFVGVGEKASHGGHGGRTEDTEGFWVGKSYSSVRQARQPRLGQSPASTESPYQNLRVLRSLRVLRAMFPSPLRGAKRTFRPTAQSANPWPAPRPILPSRFHPCLGRHEDKRPPPQENVLRAIV
jgi:hypothetical protein